jgi:hypothetical protein
MSRDAECLGEYFLLMSERRQRFNWFLPLFGTLIISFHPKQLMTSWVHWPMMSLLLSSLSSYTIIFTVLSLWPYKPIYFSILFSFLLGNLSNIFHIYLLSRRLYSSLNRLVPPLRHTFLSREALLCSHHYLQKAHSLPDIFPPTTCAPLPINTPPTLSSAIGHIILM